MNGGPFYGARGEGIQASLRAAIAYDSICCEFRIEIEFEAQAMVLSGRASPEAIRRAREIIQEIAGPIPVWDRMIWI